ncbi:lactococcin 972 family bacteriocin [Actinokineospora terrae]|uniref:Bacteriocin, lactococcin 972 family n=1 Tax=Actinokineospora terrae TaxID=155974 RepID=A0A1H9VHL1_9PSEU|nr:lactococcin 972 family bacteriocin [Actinokineospora terrae]SES20954.1 bacteriocin, lactococcin 972 family [Actinokineospora terrae]
MSSLKNRAAKAASVASLALFMIAGAASVAQADTAQTQRPAAANACGGASGGTWCKGTAADGALKRCYSNYVHPNNYHSSTAVMAGGTDKRYNSAGAWSEAHITAGWAYTCNTYYDPSP